MTTAFEKVAPDKKKIDKVGLVELLRAFGDELSEDKVSAMFDAVDEDRDGKIEYNISS